MSKAIWTMLVLVMASFTGCLGSTDDVEPEGQDDNPSDQQQSSGGDGGDNDTEDDDIFLQALQNLTSRINDLSNKTQDLIDENELLRHSIDALTSENEELQDTISNLEFYQYDPPDHSVVVVSVPVYVYPVQETGNGNGTDDNGTDEEEWSNLTGWPYWAMMDLYTVTKDNNTITIEYVGFYSMNGTTSEPPGATEGMRNCTDSNSGISPPTTFYNSDGTNIASFAAGVYGYLAHNATIISDCEIEEGFVGQWNHLYWSKIIVELAEEPARFSSDYGLYTFT